MEKISATPERRAHMSDVAIARNLIREIAGDAWDGKGDMLARVHSACLRHGKSFTARRIRSFWHGEAAIVAHNEIVSLAEVATAEKSKRDRIDAARASHAEFINRASAVLDRLSAQDADFHGEYIAALRTLASGPTGDQSTRDRGEISACVAGRGAMVPMDCAGDRA